MILQANGYVTDEGGKLLNGQLQTHIFHSGALEIFIRRKPVLDPPIGSHFKKDSGYHSNRFVRIGNALVDDQEIDFLAAAALRFVNQDLRVISVDTTSIVSIGYAAAALLSRACALRSHPVITSFGSYHLRTNFCPIGKTLFLISFSSSGRLANLVIGKGYYKEQVLTVFSMFKDQIASPVICDIRQGG